MASSTNPALGKALWDARVSGELVSTDQHPRNIEEAYTLLWETTAVSGQTVVGYKLGATTEAALELMKISEPFAGPLFESSSFESGHAALVHAAHSPAIETEIVLGLKKALPSNGGVTEQEVAAAVDWVGGGFEIIGSRFASMPTGRGVCTIGDGAGNHMVVTGSRYADWQSLDPKALTATLIVNGTVVANGMSRDSIHGSPIAMLTWFANSAFVPDRGIQAGDMIYCGTCTGLTPIKYGDVIEADFGVLGRVSTTITG